MKRYISFCFDDGYLASAEKLARIFSDQRCAACFCVLAAPQLTEDPFIRASQVGDWSYWRDLAAAGHEIAPHGYAHERLARLSITEACQSIQKTWDVFERELPGFQPRHSVFHAAYLTAPDDVVEWICNRALGVRMSLGRAGLNSLDPGASRKRIDCVTFAPPHAEMLAEARLERFIEAEEGWLVMVFHGVDGEGWGSVRSVAIGQMLKRARSVGLDVVTPNRLLLGH